MRIQAGPIRGADDHVLEPFRWIMNVIRGEAGFRDQVRLPEPVTTEKIAGGGSPGIGEPDGIGIPAGDQASAAGRGDDRGGQEVRIVGSSPVQNDLPAYVAKRCSPPISKLGNILELFFQRTEHSFARQV